ncbi:MAG: MarR family transcriptional regulator [Rhodoferax sp.]|uniref:MarR family winged helix-turn-helix transcriptional regulator n=1 Tax=Rhodoferax sp. TaxID=50421 RepID=UPI0008AC6EAF|nr:MarR family transcriptional regulator [Rhodoferax sp.]MDP2679131.1 MarR family transcriptional regulator [Rhodoferax sp.]OGB50801.1 MAG: MarR family transcriptional regulator [Burkholderiales bacterium RIFOXYD12_FULL_59_19]OGB74902.1 MAG: MarR family transcriptional regulator [Burkholderiales bacterium RIFOXYC12_FULL_60_6]
MTQATEPATDPTPAFTLYDEPGHLIRRAQQIAVSKFHEVHGRQVTPIQYAVLRTLFESPGVDQVTLAQLIALDTSSTADIATRLEAKGWILREVLPRRQRSLLLTPAGEAVLQGMRSGIEQMYLGMMDSLDGTEQREFMRLLRKFVHLNDPQNKPIDATTKG